MVNQHQSFMVGLGAAGQLMVTAVLDLAAEADIPVAVVQTAAKQPVGAAHSITEPIPQTALETQAMAAW
ncbi:MAG: hypothetical protein Alpg2KO_26440 [Alphaproteobacteria bacterium]